MSTDASTHAGDETTTADDFEELRDYLRTLREEAIRKVESGRVYDAENERIRIKWIRIAKDVLAEERKTVEAQRLSELTEEVERLKEANGIE